MDEATRKDCLARIRSQVAAIKPSEWSFIEHCLQIILSLASDPRLGPLTYLTPDEQAIEKIDIDEENVPVEIRDQCLGLLLDQLIIGKLPGPGEDMSQPTQYSTLGGATATLSRDEGGLVLTDTTGRKVRVTEPIIDGPKLTMRQSDGFVMWDEWAWL
jgi:hypothetical protein